MKVMTYIRHDCDDVEAITMEDYDKLSESEKIDLIDSTEEYVWQEAESKSEAIQRYDEAFMEWKQDILSGYDGPGKFY